MSICWYCHWGWPLEVANIARAARADLGGDSHLLEYGPAHVVWCDENFGDANIEACIRECDQDRGRYGHISDAEMAVVRRSLVDLLAVPAHVRECVPADYDGECPADYPPPEGVTVVRDVWGEL